MFNDVRRAKFESKVDQNNTKATLGSKYKTNPKLYWKFLNNLTALERFKCL